jgi:hypothetical protein
MEDIHMYKIIIDGADTEVTIAAFEMAIFFCEQEYGYEGEAWELIKKSNDFHELADFLTGDGIYAEVVKIL